MTAEAPLVDDRRARQAHPPGLAAGALDWETVASIVPEALLIVSPEGDLLWANGPARELGSEHAREGIRACAMRAARGIRRRHARPYRFAAALNVEGGQKTFLVHASTGPGATVLLLEPLTGGGGMGKDRRTELLVQMGERVLEIAHEMRKPLQPIGAYAGLLGEELSGDASLKAHAEMIAHSAERLSSTLNGILDFARPGRLDRCEVGLAELVEELWERALACVGRPDRSYDLAQDYAQGVERVRCDRERLSGALFNILTNALEAMPDGGAVRVSSKRVVCEDVVFSMIEIADTGVGIERGKVNRVTEAFYTTKPGGVGLGLAVVEKTIGEHGGSLSISSEQGKGTAVRLTLPDEVKPDE